MPEVAPCPLPPVIAARLALLRRDHTPDADQAELLAELHADMSEYATQTVKRIVNKRTHDGQPLKYDTGRLIALLAALQAAGGMFEEVVMGPTSGAPVTTGPPAGK